MSEGIYEDAEDEGGSDVGDGDGTEVEGQTADTGDEDGSDNEEVAVVIKIHVLEHPETGNSDEAIESYADAAHDAGRNGIDKGYEGSKEAQNDAADGSGGDGDEGSIAGDGYAAYGLTIGGVGAAAEESTDHGADAIAKKGAGKTGLFANEVAVDDGREVLMVSDMLCKYNECNGHIKHCDIAKSGEINAFTDVQEGEIRNMDPAADRTEIKSFQSVEGEDLEVGVAGSIADKGEDKGCCIACEDTDDEGDEPCHLFAVYGAGDNGAKSDKTAKDGNEVILAGYRGLGQIANSVACKAQTDDGNGGSDDDGRHELVDPLGAAELNDSCDDDIDKTRQHSADEDAEVAEYGGGIHGAQERKGAAQEDGALALGEELVAQSTEAGAHKSCCDVHVEVDLTVAVDENRYNEGRCHDGEHLLQCKDQHLTKLRAIFDIVDKFHENSLLFHSVARVELGHM